MSLRFFVALFINTGLILVIVNAQIDFNFVGYNFVTDGLYPDFNVDWYSNIGTQLIMMMLFNTVAPHTGLLAWVFFRRYMRWRFPAITQRERNHQFLGPTFFMSLRLAQQLMTFFVTLTYGSGLPILYPITAMGFVITYWVDKVAFLRFYRIPPNYSMRLSRWASSLLSWAVLMHLFVAIWMYSTPGIFAVPNEDGGVNQAIDDVDDSGETVFKFVGGLFDLNKVSDTWSFAERLSLDHILPIYAFITILLAVKIVGSLYNVLVDIQFAIGLTFSPLAWCFGSSSNSIVYLNKDFYEALDQGYLHGLKSFNPLANPVYMRAFGINRKFAMLHTHVGSVQDLPVQALPRLPETELMGRFEGKSPRAKSITVPKV